MTRSNILFRIHRIAYFGLQRYHMNQIVLCHSIQQIDIKFGARTRLLILALFSNWPNGRLCLGDLIPIKLIKKDIRNI